jgi:hypothetical protein
MNNLATILRVRTRYDEAEVLYRRCLTILKKTVGPDHPSMATCLQNYATLLRKAGRENEATSIELEAPVESQ